MTAVAVDLRERAPLGSALPAAVLRTEEGIELDTPADRWFRDAEPAELRALSGVVGPALDIGCGPGRHLLALAERGIPALGIDITTSALHHARARNVAVLQRCVFDPVPGSGRWTSALLLDGNLGIGGDPVRLLNRVGEIVSSQGRALVEVEAPGDAFERRRVHFEIGGIPGPTFLWTRVDTEGLSKVARAANLRVADRWCDDDRWFAWLSR